jgi:hypothetical protein
MPKPTKQPKKKGRAPPRSVSIASGPNKGFSRSSSPASYDVTLESPTQFRIAGLAQVSKEYGSGLRCFGRQQLCAVATTAANSNLFVAGAASITANGVLLSPDALNGRVQTIASIYARYAFRRVKYVYITRVATTQAGGMALAYSSDPELLTIPEETGSYATTQDITPCKVFPFRKEEVVLTVDYRGDRTWFVELDGTTAAGVRQTAQGLLIGYPDASGIGVITQGEIYVEYVLDLYQAQTVVAMAGLNLGATPELRSLRNRFCAWVRSNPERAARVARALLQEQVDGRSEARVKPPPTLLPE